MAEPVGRGLRTARRSGLTSPEPARTPTAPRPPRTPSPSPEPRTSRTTGERQDDRARNQLAKLLVQESRQKRATGIGRWIEAQPVRGHRGVIDGVSLRYRLVALPAGGDGRRAGRPELQAAVSGLVCRAGPGGGTRRRWLRSWQNARSAAGRGFAEVLGRRPATSSTSRSAGRPVTGLARARL